MGVLVKYLCWLVMGVMVKYLYRLVGHGSSGQVSV